MGCLNCIRHLCRHFGHGSFRTEIGLAGDETHNALKVFPLTDRKLEWNNRRIGEGFAQAVNRIFKTGILTPHAIDEDDPRFAQFVQSMPGQFRPHLGAGDGIDKHQTGFSDVQGANHLTHKIDIARCINQVYFDVLIGDRHH